MESFVDVATGILASASQRLEVVAQNISNAATPGYKRSVSFPSVLAAADVETRQTYATDFTQGRQVVSGNPYDLAISSEGFFCVRSPGGPLYTRDGQFQLGGDGRLVTAQGYALQADGGGDIVVKGGTFLVQADGTVTEDGQPTAKIAIVSLPQNQATSRGAGGLFAAPEDQVSVEDAPSVRQGAFETSNVSTGDEMIRLMETLRQAETGQRLVGVYDDLMGRVLNTLGGAA
ncbi:MAG: flagellar hook-basal body protein [Caulobacterales bacterium]